MHIQYMREMISPSSQSTVEAGNHITLLIIYYVSSRLVTLPKVIDVPVQVSDVLVLTICFKVDLL